MHQSPESSAHGGFSPPVGSVGQTAANAKRRSERGGGTAGKSGTAARDAKRGNRADNAPVEGPGQRRDRRNHRTAGHPQRGNAVAFESLKTMSSGLLAFHGPCDATGPCDAIGSSEVSDADGSAGPTAAAASLWQQQWGVAEVTGELGMFVGGRVLAFVIAGGGHQKFDGRLDPVGGGPCQPLLGRETAAMAPALLGRIAAAAVALTGKRGRTPPLAVSKSARENRPGPLHRPTPTPELNGAERTIETNFRSEEHIGRPLELATILSGIVPLRQATRLGGSSPQLHPNGGRD